MERSVAKPEWGTKRICPSCGTRYYDLLREPVICPKCSTPYDPEAFLKSRAKPSLPLEPKIVTRSFSIRLADCKWTNRWCENWFASPRLLFEPTSADAENCPLVSP